jgi:hypothetical protein
MKLAAFIFALSLAGCASHTSQIAASANDVRAAVGAARGHLEAARGNLDQIEIAAANVHEQLGYVQDTISPIYLTLQYASAAVVLVAIAIGIYIIKK